MKLFKQVAVMVMLVGAFACTKKQTDNGNSFHFGLKDDVKTLDPVNAYDSVSWEVLPQICESPLQYQYLNDELVLEPLLSDGMPQYSKDGLTITLKIKKGLMFADDSAFKANGGKGREVKAADFIYAFKRFAIPAVQAQGAWIFEGKIVGFNEFEKKLQAAKGDDFKKAFDEPIPGFVQVDDYTIQMKLSQPFPTMSYILAMPFTSPVAREVAEAYSDKDGNLRDHPVGTGPYMLKSWETNQRLVLVRNPNYHGTYPTTGSEKAKAAGLLADAGKPIPFIDTLVFEIIKEDQPRILKFEKGDIDSFELNKDSFRAALNESGAVREDLAKKGVTAESEDTPVIWYVGFNMNDKLLQNKYLRQAISSAIDRAKWVETFQKFDGLKQTEVTPPGLLDRLGGSSIKYDYNVEKAKALLAKAGYPDGQGLPVLNFDFRGTETRYRQLGEYFVQQLGAIGIKVNVVMNTFPAYIEKAKQGNLQVFLGAWIYDYPDAENGYQLLYGPNKAPGPNDTSYQNPTFDALYKKMSVMPAAAKGRKELIRQMEGIIQEDVPWAYGFYQRIFRLRQPWVKNFKVAELVLNRYKYMRVERDPKK